MLKNNKAKKKIKSFDADKGYDSEENHKLVVEELRAEDRIRLKNKDKPIHKTRGMYRKSVFGYKEDKWFNCKKHKG